jgi:uncharacterized coiled-coil DUF342 family protein
MNKQRRTEIANVIKELQAVPLDDSKNKLEDLKGSIEDLRDQEQEYFDNMPESLHGSEKGQAAEAAVTSMEEMIEKIGTLVEAIEEFQNASDLEDILNS